MMPFWSRMQQLKHKFLKVQKCEILGWRLYEGMLSGVGSGPMWVKLSAYLSEVIHLPYIAYINMSNLFHVTYMVKGNFTHS